MIVVERYANEDRSHVIERRVSKPGGQRGHMLEFRGGELVARGTGYGKRAVAAEARRAGLVQVDASGPS